MVVITTMNEALQLGCVTGLRGHHSHVGLWPNNHCCLGGPHEEVTDELRFAGQEGLAYVKMVEKNLHAQCSIGKVAVAGGSLLLTGNRKETGVAGAEGVKDYERGTEGRALQEHCRPC